MSSILQSIKEEPIEEQNSTRKRSLYPIKNLLAHLDIDLDDDDDHEATNLTSSTLNFLSITKQFTNAEICELSDTALEKLAAEFLEARSTFGESGNAKMGEKFWPTGHYEKKWTYAKHPTFIKENIKLIMVNQRHNKRATYTKRMKKRRNLAAEGGMAMPEGSASGGGSSPPDTPQSSSTAEQGGSVPHSATANIPKIEEGSIPVSPSRIKRSATPDGLPSPISFHSPSTSPVNGTPDRLNTPKRRRCDPSDTGKPHDRANATTGIPEVQLGSADESSGTRSPYEQALIDGCSSIGWDAGVSAIQLQIERYQAEIRRAGAQAETEGNDRKRLNCDHISDALQELLSRVYAERGKKQERMKADSRSWFDHQVANRRACST